MKERNYSVRCDISMQQYVRVADAAAYLCITPRRVRQLLEQQRIAGDRPAHAWRVFWPIQYTLSRRGPLLSFARKQTEPRPPRTYRLSRFQNQGRQTVE